MRIVTYILMFVLLCAGAQASVPLVMDEGEEIGLHKGLDECFLEGHLHCSPVVGIIDTVVANLRLHGHWGPQDKGFVRPATESIDRTVYPQDATAAILEFFFPSHVGFVANTVPSHITNKYFKPVNTANIFKALLMKGFFENAENGAFLITKVQKPKVFKDFEQWKKIRKTVLEVEKIEKAAQELARDKNISKKAAQESLLDCKLSNEALENIDVFRLSQLLFQALKDNHGDAYIANGYPPHIVERILLTFIWKKNTGIALKPFYDALDNKIIDKSKVKETWSGPGSFFTEQDYWTARKSEGPKTRELEIFLKLGYAYYEDRFPPVLTFGNSTYKFGKEVIRFSNCGEISLLNFLMHMLYDFDTKKFDVEKLKALQRQGFAIKPGLIYFFDVICPRPSCIKKEGVLDYFINLVSNLNAGADGPKVNYLFPAPEGGAAEFNERGVCCINVGLDNMMVILNDLMGDPEWTKYDLKASAPTDFLDRICKAFSQNAGDNLEFIWDWEVPLKPGEKVSAFDDILPNKNIKNVQDVTIVFLQGGLSVFEWQFLPIHFDFNKTQHSKNILHRDLEDRLEIKIDKTLAESAFAEYFYSGYLDSISEKIIALYKALWFKITFHKSTYDHIVTRWLEPSGKHFACWTDRYTNLSILLAFYDIIKNEDFCEYILNLKIPPINSELLWIATACNRQDNIKKILDDDKSACISDGQPRPYCQYTKMARVLTSTVEEAQDVHMEVLMAAGANQYTWDVSGTTLLHLASYAGSKTFEALMKAGLSVNQKDLNGNSPLHYAVQNMTREWDSVQKLIDLGANVNEINAEGDTPLHVAVRSNAPCEFIEHLVKRGANTNAINYAGKAPLDLACDQLAYSKVKSLIICSHISAREHATGISYIHWAIDKNAPSYIIDRLIEAGANVDALDVDGNTPLHRAVSLGGHTIEILSLLKSGANCKVRNKDDKSLMDLVADAGGKLEWIKRRQDIRF